MNAPTSDRKTLEAERAAPCPFCGGPAQLGSFYEPAARCLPCGTAFLPIAMWNRRTAAPVAEDVALPPLPHEGGLFYRSEVRQAQRDAVEAYKRKQAALQELVDQAQELDMGYGKPMQSIDTPEFRTLIGDWAENAWGNCADEEKADSCRAKLIAYIDGRIKASPDAAPAGTVPEGWRLVPVEPTDDMIVAFAEQWYSKVRCIDDCEMEDCYAALLAATPLPLPPKEEAK
jgi:hypothetical protein